ncbi:MAG: hypothetical protein R2828_22690 [Saprospiraceae bacterium]
MMKKKHYLLLLPLCALTFALQGQKINLLDYVYLHGGSFLKGQVMDTLRGGFIQLKLQNDSLMVIPISYIKKIKQDDRGKQLFENGKTAIAQGLYSRISFQFLTGTGSTYGNNYRINPSLEFSMGLHLRPWLAVGAGIALDMYNERRMVPVYLESRLYLPNVPRAPFLGLQLGYGILMDKQEFEDNFAGEVTERGGVMVYPSIGYRFSGRGNTDFLMDIGYKFQPYYFRVNYPQDWWTIREEVRSMSSSLTVRFGWVF